MVIDETHNVGWFASDRYQPYGKVAVYTFVYKSEKTVLTDTNENFIRNFAKNIIFSQKKDTIFTEKPKIEQPELEKDFSFIIYNTTVYHKYSDFKNADALRKFKELQNLKNELASLENHLNNSRNAYRQEQKQEQKVVLADKILSDEKLKSDFDVKIKALENEIRQLEINFVK